MNTATRMATAALSLQLNISERTSSNPAEGPQCATAMATRQAKGGSQQVTYMLPASLSVRPYCLGSNPMVSLACRRGAQQESK
jgi:hypothetical protein